MAKWKTSAAAVAVGLVAQGAGHALLLHVGIPLPSMWHVLPFVAGGCAAGLFARGPFAALFSAVPYAAGWLFLDATMAGSLVAVRPAPGWMVRGSHVSNVIIPMGGLLLARDGLLIVAGMALGATACVLIARQRARRAPDARPEETPSGIPGRQEPTIGRPEERE